jgi:hypothetical protein
MLEGCILLYGRSLELGVPRVSFHRLGGWACQQPSVSHADIAQRFLILSPQARAELTAISHGQDAWCHKNSYWQNDQLHFAGGGSY